MANEEDNFEDSMNSNEVDKCLAVRKLIVKNLKPPITKLGTYQ